MNLAASLLWIVLSCSSSVAYSKATQPPKSFRQRLESIPAILSRDSYKESQLNEVAITVRSMVTMASVIHTALSLLLHDTTDEKSADPTSDTHNIPAFNMNESLAQAYLLLYKSFEVALEKEPFLPLAAMDCIRNYMNFETILSRLGKLEDRMETRAYLIPPALNVVEFLVQKYATKISKWWLPGFDQYQQRRILVFSCVVSVSLALAVLAAFFAGDIAGDKSTDFMNHIKPLLMAKVFRMVAEEVIGQRLHEKLVAPLATATA